MFNRRQDHASSLFMMFHWFLLSFSAGSINAWGFLAAGRFVSHVTGFATFFGVDAVNDQPESALGILCVPIFFLVGSILAGLLIDRPFYQKKKPHFDYVMGLCSLCLFAAALYGAHLQFDKGGALGAVGLEKVYFLLSLLCLACGLQNGAVSSFTRGVVRTTHITGLTTDLGLGIAKLFTFKRSDRRYIAEVQANRLRAGLIFSFTFGSALGCLLFIRVGHHGLFLSALIAAYVAWQGREFKRDASPYSFNQD